MDRIEQEVQARVDFKLNELLTAMENTAKANWHTAFGSMSQKHTHYWEAFTQMKAMMEKEMKMAPPYDDMAEQKRRKKRDQAVKVIMETVCHRGDHDYHPKERRLAIIIESLLD